MIDLNFLQELIRTLDESGIDHIELERGGTRIRVSKSPVTSSPAVPAEGARAPVASEGAGREAPAAPSANPAAAPTASPVTDEVPAGNDGYLDITSPMVGTFYRSPSPDADAFAEVGSRISRGDPLCIIEAMKLMNELESEIEGIVREVCVANGEPVEYGQVLFRVEPA
jgi:acetyl-CoA carboxylase biotin carboxyl carrier protein